MREDDKCEFPNKKLCLFDRQNEMLSAEACLRRSAVRQENDLSGFILTFHILVIIQIDLGFTANGISGPSWICRMSAGTPRILGSSKGVFMLQQI